MPSTATDAAASAYPIPRPESGDDPRFCLGLALDIGKVLASYGYPPITTARDVLWWHQHLFTTIYHHSEETTTP